MIVQLDECDTIEKLIDFVRHKLEKLYDEYKTYNGWNCLINVEISNMNISNGHISDCENVSKSKSCTLSRSSKSSTKSFSSEIDKVNLFNNQINVMVGMLKNE